MLFKTRPNGAHPGSGRAPLVDNEGRQIVILESSTSGESGITVGRIATPSASFAVPNSAATYAIGDLIECDAEVIIGHLEVLQPLLQFSDCCWSCGGSGEGGSHELSA